MKYWITKLVICTLLMYNLLLGTNYAQASEIAKTDESVVVENLAIADGENNHGNGKRENWGWFREIYRGAEKLEGLFTVYRHPETSRTYWEIKPEQLNKNYLAIVTLESGIGESGIYSGSPLADFLFYLRRVNNNLHFVVRNVKFRTDASTPEQRSLARSFSDSVLYSLPIDRIDPQSKNIFINLDYLLVQDFPGLLPLLKYSLQADYRLEPSQSYFGEIKSFPENLEIDATYGFSSPIGANLITLPDSRSLNLKVHYSFSQLPENNAYIPRLADDRVGYFVSAFQDLSHQNPQSPFVRYINRWHLEPSDPNLPLSPPKKPIVFWIENAVPLEYRDAIREGVLMWNKAFAKAGWENAIQVQQMPDDADWQPADVRYNTIRWFNSLDAGFAKGPVRVNPLTGEILDADILVDDNMVRSFQQGYAVLGTVSNHHLCQNREKGEKPNTQDDFALMQRTTATESWRNPIVDFHRDIRPGVNDEFCYGVESVNQAAIGALALSILPNTQPTEEAMKEYMHQYVRSLIAHEVGHTLGLRHNFHGSTMLSPEELNDTEITHARGLVGSVMDYLPVNIAPQGVKQGDYFPGVVGPYDEWAIEYGYKRSPTTIATMIPEAEKDFLEQIALASPQPELSYATDEDIWDINPLANVWDMSSDVMLYSQWQMDNARVMWQHLAQGNLSLGASYGNLRVLFDRVLQYYFGNAYLLSQYIGGQSLQWLNASNHAAAMFVPVPVEKQRQALTKLKEYVFAEDAFSFSPQLLNQLAPSRWQYWGNRLANSRLDYPIHDRIFKFQSVILRSLLEGDRLNRLQDIELKAQPTETLSIPELFDTLQTGIWTEVFTPGTAKPISSIRRSLQREYLSILLDMVLGNTYVPADERTIAWYELQQLQTAIATRLQHQPENPDTYTIAHLQLAGDRITKALNAQMISR